MWGQHLDTWVAIPHFVLMRGLLKSLMVPMKMGLKWFENYYPISMTMFPEEVQFSIG